jgi:hypothetical protein
MRINKKELLAVIAERSDELKKFMIELAGTPINSKTGKPLTSNVIDSYRTYTRKKQRTLSVIRVLANSLADDREVAFDSDEERKGYNDLFLPETVASTAIIIQEGDNFFDIAERYSNRKGEDIAKAAEKAGLTVNKKTGKYYKLSQD